jgi:hypothetical protein
LNEVRVHVLFVGDDLLADCYLKTELEHYGYEVEYISSEGDLISRLVRNEKPVDLLLLDNSSINLEKIVDEHLIKNIHVPILFIQQNKDDANLDKITDGIPYKQIEKNSSPSEYNFCIKKLLNTVKKSNNPERTDDLIDAFALHEIICDDKGNPVDYRFIDADKKFLLRIGKTKEDIIGKTAMELFPKTEKIWIETFGRVALTGISETITEYSAEFDNYYEARVYSSEKGKFLALFIDLDKMKGKYK